MGRIALAFLLCITAGCQAEHKAPPAQLAKPRPVEQPNPLRQQTDRFFLKAKNSPDLDSSKPLAWEFAFTGVKADGRVQTMIYLWQQGFVWVIPSATTEDGLLAISFREIKTHSADSFYERVLQLSQYAHAQGFRLQDRWDVLAEADAKAIQQPKIVVPWDDAKAIIREGNVAVTSQSHKLDVVIGTSDGVYYDTKEPKIDAVHHWIRECGKWGQIECETE